MADIKQLALKQERGISIVEMQLSREKLIRKVERLRFEQVSFSFHSGSFR
jgi:hypothetical protein